MFFQKKTATELFENARETFDTALHKLNEALDLNVAEVDENLAEIIRLNNRNNELNAESEKIKRFKIGRASCRERV